MGANKVTIAREKEELKKTLNHKRGALISVKDATELLAELHASLEENMQAAHEVTHRRQKASLRVPKSTEGRKVQKTGSTDDPYTAVTEFSKMRNKPQDRANMGQRQKVFLDGLLNLAKAQTEQTPARITWPGVSASGALARVASGKILAGACAGWWMVVVRMVRRAAI